MRTVDAGGPLVGLMRAREGRRAERDVPKVGGVWMDGTGT